MFNRDEWGYWLDYDKDCQDTRQEVLIAESEILVTFTDEKKCRVATGKWTDVYTGSVFLTPSGIDIDHVVSIKEAHDSGGHAWDRDKKRAYFNDLNNPAHLIAISSSANRSKGDKQPHEWMPPNKNYWCKYLGSWVLIKYKWELNMDEAEYDGIVKLFSENCTK